VDAVGVVEQRRRDERDAGVEGEPEQHDAEERGAGAGWDCGGHLRECRA
jgi:hypothetical protein